jgi:hypothetical protein
MLTVRQWHTYIGAFIAPSVLFFAFTGSLQLFSLHEAHGAYTPPAIIQALGRVHKDQVLKESPEPASEGADAHDDHDHDHHAAAAPTWPVVALKWVFLAVAIGLITSTLLGLWLAFTFGRRKAVVLALFVAGAALPVLLLLA